MPSLKKILRLGRLKIATKSTIAKHRRSYPVRLVHDLARFVDQAVENDGSDFEINGEKDLLRKLNKADFRTVLDIGANVGNWSSVALAAWPNCHVHAFEVAPNTFADLKRALQTPEFSSRTTLNELAVSDTNGTQTMYYFADSPELTCDMPRHESLTSVPFECKVTTLSDYCRNNGISNVDFLKVDVEGAEYRVLKGFFDYLSSGKVACVQFEYGAFSIQTRKLLADYFEILSEYFWIGKIFPGYVDFRDYHWTMEGFRFCNYFCVSRTRPDLKELVIG